MNGGRRHCRYGVPMIEHFVPGQDVVGEILQIDRIFAHFLDLVFDVRHVLGRDHSIDARQRFRRAHVDRLDTGMGVRAAKNLPI